MKITAYLHSNMKEIEDLGIANGLTGEALEHFKYALFEVRFELKVDKETGEAVIVSVDGAKVMEERKE